MSYVVIHTFPGGTKEQYEAASAAVFPTNAPPPKGLLSEVAGTSDAGWTIVATFDSKPSWERFRDDTLLPALGKGISGSFTTPPSQEIAFEVSATLC